MTDSVIRLLSFFAVSVGLSASPASAQNACAADVDDNGVVDGPDLKAVLAWWGECTGCAADINSDGIVNGDDLGALLDLWGATCQPLPWAEVLEFAPDPAVVTNPSLRSAILATGLPWRVRDNGSGIEMLLVPPGTFNMGCSRSVVYGCGFDESPVHSVTLTNAFYIGRYEVTQAQWTAKMGSNPSYFSNLPDSPNRPVEQVSWNTVQGFLAATGLRLLTEAEWEYAYRAGTTTAFHGWTGFPSGTNNDALAGDIAWYSGNNGPCCSGPTYGTKVVGTRAASALGLHDMSGNVWEWLNDRYSSTYYASSPSINPTGPATGSNRVVRGGSWDTWGGTLYLRSSARDWASPSFSNRYGGLRVARSP